MHLTDDELILHHYGERAPTDTAGAAAHLETCRTCGAAYAQLQRTLAAVDDSRPPEPPAGFERAVWARLQPELEHRQRTWLAWWVFSPARLALVATLALLVAGAFLAGRMSTRPGAAPDPVATSKVRERVLLADLGDHLDRSQAMLIELVSGGAGASGMSAERERAEQLVSDNRLYRQTAAATGNAALVTVLDELERVLVDIAASPDVASANDLEQVRREIDTNGLLFKVRVLSSDVRERQRAAMRLRTGQSS
ncbi:MAG: hypothetical protein V7647_2093 [Acidobacteriota bacterium]|jgi:predicted anti-sigma-YlaC factor YlaD